MPAPIGLSSRSADRFGRAILGWGEDHRRVLPWRETRDPWAVLVSEVMLQQTQAPRVVVPFSRFLRAFPTPMACAEAGSAAVVRAWEGLGYNRRARSLHGAAMAIVERHGGRVPSDRASLEALPGIGPYTARAVLVFAFEQDAAVVDTNVARVLARSVAGRPLSARQAQDLADRLLPSGRSWAYNQSMLDLGAGHCTSRRPGCAGCPLRRRCVWARAGWPLPDPARSTAGTARPQARFEGSDRQGRGRLIDTLRRGTVPSFDVARAAGWPEDPGRADRVLGDLIAEGLVRRSPDGSVDLA